MNFGLYNLKYSARKWLFWILPYMEKINPNWVSLLLLPIGLCIAYFYWADRYILGSVFILLRLFFGTLDGLIAEHFKKGTATGEILNRLTPEISDLLLMGVLAWKDPSWGILALIVAWLTTFSGLIGLAVKKPIQSVGPVGQTDRLAALILCSLIPLANPMRLFLIWTIFGGLLTIVLRLKRQFAR